MRVTNASRQFKTVRMRNEMKLKQNSFETVLKQF